MSRGLFLPRVLDPKGALIASAEPKNRRNDQTGSLRAGVTFQRHHA
jgi:hypothetical protein